ncbi:MAG: hypothetical protein JSV00_05090 [bacterium]|nr:MAG: hypothetical protein JSV00_05090 [bacterium]
MRDSLSMAVLLLGLGPLTALASEVGVSSFTTVHIFQQDQALGPDVEYAPLYEHLALDLWEAGRPEISFHLYGWGRFDLGEDSGADSPDGHLSSAHGVYDHRKGAGRLRMGRFLLSEGTALEALDGIQVRESFGQMGFSLFGGKPNGDGGSEGERGDSILGTRAYFLSPGRLEVGLNYLTEDGDFAGDEREEAGGDLWLRPTSTLELTGHVLYNLSTSGLASGDLALRVRTSDAVEVTLSSENYSYEDLFQAVTNPAFLGTSPAPGDRVRIYSAALDWHPAGRLAFRGAVKNILHDEDDPGRISRSEMGLDFTPDSLLEKVGLRAAVQTADQPENEYNEMRGFAMAAIRDFRFSLDAQAILYGERISGEDTALQVVGSAGWSPDRTFALSGDVRFTQSPVYEEDVAVVLRATYGLGTVIGEKR